MDPVPLLRSIRRIFSDANLFGKQFVNDPRYLPMCRLHARVCGLLTCTSLDPWTDSEIGRKYRIDPLIGLNGRFQRQAEADASPRELVHIRYPSTTRYLLRRCIAVAAHRIF